jgi:hypothetical protein
MGFDWDPFNLSQWDEIEWDEINAVWGWCYRHLQHTANSHSLLLISGLSGGRTAAVIWGRRVPSASLAPSSRLLAPERVQEGGRRSVRWNCSAVRALSQDRPPHAANSRCLRRCTPPERPRVATPAAACSVVADQRRATLTLARPSGPLTGTPQRQWISRGLSSCA